MSNDTDKMAVVLKEQIEKFRKIFKLPDIGTAALMEAQLSIQTAAEISQRQLEILRATAEHLASMLQDTKLSTTQQRDLAVKALEAALTSSKELAEMTVKFNTEAFDLVEQRLTENFGEMRKSWNS